MAKTMMIGFIFSELYSMEHSNIYLILMLGSMGEHTTV